MPVTTTPLLLWFGPYGGVKNHQTTITPTDFGDHGCFDFGLLPTGSISPRLRCFSSDRRTRDGDTSYVSNRWALFHFKILVAHTHRWAYFVADFLNHDDPLSWFRIMIGYGYCYLLCVPCNRYTLLTWALRSQRPSEVALLTVGEPAGSTFLCYLLFGETISFAAMCGCALNLFAIWRSISIKVSS